MSDPTFTDPPATGSPQRGSATFAADAQASWDWLYAVFPQMQIAITWFRGRTDEVAAATASAGSSASSANASATTAASDALQAGSDRVASESAADYIRATYLGAQAADPVVDGNGAAVADGAWYDNTTTGAPRIRRSGQWVDAVMDAAGAMVASNNLSDLTDIQTAKENIGVADVERRLSAGRIFSGI